jgi:tRNA (cmo5U34)-methyltransferase
MTFVEPFEGERAARYDHFIKRWCPGYEWLHELIPSVLATCLASQPVSRILVAGCGTGTEMEYMLKLRQDWHLTGVDPSPEMTSQAATRLAPFLSSSYEVITGLVEDLAVEQKFDAATLLLVLHFLPENGAKQNLLQSLSQRLHTGAPLIILDMFGDSETMKFQLQLLKGWLLEKGVKPNVVESGSTYILENFHYIPEERLFALLHEAGFTPICRFTQSLMYGGWIALKQE